MRKQYGGGPGEGGVNNGSAQATGTDQPTGTDPTSNKNPLDMISKIIPKMNGGKKGRKGSRRGRKGSRRGRKSSCKKGGQGVIETAAVPFGLLALQRYFKGSKTSKSGVRSIGNTFKRTLRFKRKSRKHRKH